MLATLSTTGSRYLVGSRLISSCSLERRSSSSAAEASRSAADCATAIRRARADRRTSLRRTFNDVRYATPYSQGPSEACPGTGSEAARSSNTRNVAWNASSAASRQGLAGKPSRPSTRAASELSRMRIQRPHCHGQPTAGPVRRRPALMRSLRQKAGTVAARPHPHARLPSSSILLIDRTT